MTSEPPVDTIHAVNTPDVTLTYVAWLDHARRNRWMHLHCDIRALYDMKLWDFGEDGSCYHNYHSQHESSRYSNHQFPASRDSSTRYFDESFLPQHRPTALSFTQQNWNYPLERSRQIITCPPCGGSGRVNCGRCGGSGRCSTCGGSGKMGGSQCSSCAGNGRCSTCAGNGRVTCGTCSGEGQLLTYTSKDYKWWHDTDEETILSPLVDRLGVKGLVSGVRKKGGSVRIERFTRDEVLRTTGVFNSRIERLLERAEERRRQLETTIGGRSDSVLFQVIRRDYVPLLYLNLFAGRKYGQCFVAGTRLEKSVQFPLPLSLTKCSAWVALVTFIVLCLSRAASLPLLLANFLLLAGLIGYGVYQSVQVNAFVLPRRWVVLDDERCGAWQFAYLFAQAISRYRVARIVDPWFTALLEPPDLDSVRGRNSFLYTIESIEATEEVESTSGVSLGNPLLSEEGRETGTTSVNRSLILKSHPGMRSKTEFLVIGKRAQNQFQKDVYAVAAEADRYILMANDDSVQALTARITDLLGARPAQNRKPVQITVVTDIDARNLKTGKVLDASDFPPITSVSLGIMFDVLALPLGRMCEEARTGSISEGSEAGYRHLLDFGGYAPIETEHEAVSNSEAIAPTGHEPDNGRYNTIQSSPANGAPDLNSYVLNPDAQQNDGESLVEENHGR